MHPSTDPFLEQIQADPRDDSLRLIYADWLEEHGDQRGEFLRLLVEQRRETPPFDWHHSARQKTLNQMRRGCPVEWLAAVDELFSDANIRRIIDMPPEMVGHFPPYSLSCESSRDSYVAANEYLQKVIAALRKVRTLDVLLTDVGSFGSGYASFGQIFCSKINGLATAWKNGVAETTGISIEICRLAPVAVWAGSMIRQSNGARGGPDFIEPKNVYVPEDDSWKLQTDEIEAVLSRYGFTLPRAEELQRKLPFEAHIPTLLNFGTYRYLDAFFYWED